MGKHLFYEQKHTETVTFVLPFASLFAWGLTALSAQIGYIAP